MVPFSSIIPSFPPAKRGQPVLKQSDPFKLGLIQAISCVS